MTDDRSPMIVLTFNMHGSPLKQFPYRITGHQSLTTSHASPEVFL
jgi:hypothetical protein